MKVGSEKRLNSAAFSRVFGAGDFGLVVAKKSIRLNSVYHITPIPARCQRKTKEACLPSKIKLHPGVQSAHYIKSGTLGGDEKPQHHNTDLRASAGNQPCLKICLKASSIM